MDKIIAALDGEPFPTCDDSDDDGVPNGIDNCPDEYNPDQADADTSTPEGDVCEPTPEVTCPCFTPADLAAIDGKFIDGTLKAGFNCSGVTDSTRVQTEEWETERFGSDPYAITLNVTNNPAINPNTELPTIQCNYKDNTGVSTSKFLRVQDGTITPEQVVECFAQVVAHNTDTSICDGNRSP